MNKRWLFAGVLIGELLGCSSARVEAPTPPAIAMNSPHMLPAPLVAVSPPQVSQVYQLPAPPPPPQLPFDQFKVCKLGESCLTMDERPFEACLLSSTRCADKIKEPLLVEGPREILPPGTTVIVRPRPE